MSEIAAALERWQMDMAGVRRRMYRSPTARERERWHALWMLGQGWPAVKVAEMLERDPHTIGDWLATFVEEGPDALGFEQTGGPPPPSTPRSRPL